MSNIGPEQAYLKHSFDVSRVQPCQITELKSD
jgi:hypothetical protein